MAYIEDTFRKDTDTTDNLVESATRKFITPGELTQISTNQTDITNLQTDKINVTEKGAVNGVATLDAGGKIPSAQLPAIGLTDVYVVADITARDALTVQEGDVAKVLDADGLGNPETFIYDGAAWVSLKSDDAVDSVNGQTGTVSLDTDDITEGTTNLYYTEARVSANTDVAANTTNRHASGSDNQNLWATISADTGNTTANTQTDTLTVAGANGVTTSITGDTLTITGADTAYTVTTQAVNYNAAIGDYVRVNAAGIAITLPTAVGLSGRTIVVKRINMGGTKPTVETTGAETIDGAANLTLQNQYDSFTFISNGTNWEVI